MYTFNAKILFVACPPEVVQTIREIQPLPDFSFEFGAADSLGADEVSFYNLIILGPEVSLTKLSDWAREAPDTEFIALRKEFYNFSDGELSLLHDVWPYPITPGFLTFYFQAWQKQEKKSKELWQTSQYLESIMETSPNLIWFKTKDGIHELVNSCFCNTVGKTKDDVLGKGHGYIWNVEGEDPACVESERVVMESGQTHSATEEIETGGGRRILTTFKSPLRNLDGSMMGTIGIGVDITKERNYYTQLIRNKELLETIFANIECGIICHSLDGKRVISINAAALRLLDYNSREDLEYGGFQMVADSVLDEDKAKLRKEIAKLKNVGDNVSFEYRVRHSSGRVLHLMGNAKLVDRDGEIICERFLLDVTDQKMREKAEQDEKERRNKELILALAMDYQLVYVVDSKTEDSVIVQLRKDPDSKLFDIFSGGDSHKEDLKNYINTCVHPEDREALAQACSVSALKSALKHNMMRYFPYRALNGDDVHYYQMKAVRAGKREGDYNIIIGFQSVNERTRQEMEQKAALAEALQEAKKASTAKSLFLFNMSHDIRTPMNAVVGYTNLALAQLDNPKNVQAYLEKILASGQHLISLINDILNMSYIESGKVQLEEKPFNLKSLLGELWNIVYPAAEAKGHELSFDTDEISNWDIFCDRLRFNQIFLNLLGNSVKYTPDGGKITLKARELPCPGSDQAAYEFRIRDNGIGMSEEFLVRIFNPFERAQTSTIAGIEGTGLGMTITKKIVDIMQGDIEVSSKEGEGTEFVFRAVFQKAPPTALEERVTFLDNSSGKNLIPRAKHTGRILLTEDNLMNQEIACEFLCGAGYEVDVAENGQEAVLSLEKAGPGYYDVVLMDVQMPVMDGYEATEIIRGFSNPELADIPIIAMTANSFEEDRAEAIRRGMNGHIAKPIDFSILYDTLDKLLAGKKMFAS